jgi:hypothetical protein
MSIAAVYRARSDRLRMASYPVVVVLMLSAVGAGLVSVPLALVPVAALLGWSHLRSI